METGGRTNPDRLWIGAIPAGLFRSDDRGETWQLVSSLWNVPERKRWLGGGYDAAGIHSISPDPRDEDRVFLAISCGGVWESRDAGDSWSVLGKGLFAPYVPPEQAEDSAIQDPHRVVRCASAPDVMWMQHHAGIYRSTDAGAHWTRLSPPTDDFGFAVAAHPRQAQIAWFVPAIKDEIRMPRDGALCVTRTDDGGQSWEVMRHGLPSATPMTSSIATASKWTRPANGWQWAQPPARCGRAKTAGAAGRSSTPICRRSTRCGLFEVLA